jgi:hypothetical protein
MKKALSTILLLTLSISANSQEIKRRTFSKTTTNYKYAESDSFYQAMPLDTLWEYLIYKKGGCLTGGQFVKDGRFGNEGCIMSDFNKRGKGWKTFFSYPKAELTYFLVEKLADTNKTRIHTCPCFSARCGEVAVYALHKIYLKNWFDFEPFKIYGVMGSSSCADGPQIWLQEILKDEEQRKVMRECWLGMVE